MAAEFKNLVRVMTAKGELAKVLTPDGKQVWPVETILWQGRQQLIGSWDGGDYVNFSLTKPLNQLKTGLVLFADPVLTGVTFGTSLTVTNSGLYIPKAYFSSSMQIGFTFGSNGQVAINIDHPAGQGVLRFLTVETVHNGPVYVTKIIEY